MRGGVAATPLFCRSAGRAFEQVAAPLPSAGGNRALPWFVYGGV